MVKYYSDETKKFYESIQELQSAEKALADERAARKAAQFEAQKKREQEQKRKSQERRIDADKVTKAYKQAQEAFETAKKANSEYKKVLGEFCRKHGGFHQTLSIGDIGDAIEDIFNMMFL